MELSNYQMIKNKVTGISRVRLNFGKDLALSIITGQGAMCTENRPYEIAVLQNGKITNMVGINDQQVLGYLSEDDVNCIIKKLYTITGQEPMEAS